MRFFAAGAEHMLLVVERRQIDRDEVRLFSLPSGWPRIAARLMSPSRLSSIPAA
jgi:hypothetical protein